MQASRLCLSSQLINPCHSEESMTEESHFIISMSFQPNVTDADPPAGGQHDRLLFSEAFERKTLRGFQTLVGLWVQKIKSAQIEE